MNNRFYPSSLICTECGKIVQIQRRNEVKRAKGHIKDMYCPYCKTDRKFVEKLEWGQVRTLADAESVD